MWNDGNLQLNETAYVLMMMMFMSRLVERVINGPQMRCRSDEQVSSERQWEERVAARRAAGKLCQMTGPATAKLLLPSVVSVVLLYPWVVYECH